MQSFFRVDLTLAVFVSVAYGQGVIASAKGDVGISYGMQVEINNYADANYINQAEIVANAVNACGRTLLAGDISEAGVTEELLETGNYTTTTQGGTITMVISQRYANGSGPFACDLDEASNALGAYGQTNLTVTRNNAEYGTGDLTLSIAMPTDLKCIGASTGNMCTVRCINNFSFGGCITVQQTDVTANVNTVDNIVTEEKKSAISAQVVQNQKDLPAAKKGLAAAGTIEKEGLYIVKAILAGDANIDKDAAADIVSSAASANGTTTTGTRKTRATRSRKTKTGTAFTRTGTVTAAAATATRKTKTRTGTGPAAAATASRRTRTRTRTATASTNTGTVAAAAAAANKKTRTKAATATGPSTTGSTSATRIKSAHQLRWAVRRPLDDAEE